MSSTDLRAEGCNERNKSYSTLQQTKKVHGSNTRGKTDFERRCGERAGYKNAISLPTFNVRHFCSEFTMSVRLETRKREPAERVSLEVKSCQFYLMHDGEKYLKVILDEAMLRQIESKYCFLDTVGSWAREKLVLR